MHKITFQPTDTRNPSTNVLRLAPLLVPSQLSSPPLNNATAGLPSASLSPIPTLSDELCAATARIPISLICLATLNIISCFPHSHPQAVVCSGFIEPDACSVHSTVPTPDSPEVSPMLAAEYAELHPKVPAMYHNYLDVFSKSKGMTLPLHHPYNHQIELEPDTALLFSLIYLLSKVEQLVLKTFLNKNLANQFIHPLQLPTSAPILFIKKKDSSLCLTVNYHSLNKVTKKDRYPLPLILDLLDCLRMACLFTKINLHRAYNLIHIANGDKWKTVFHMRYGSYKFNVMHYGLTNTPASFQQFMNDVFKGLLDICIMVYLDDILIYSDNPADHDNHI